MCGRYALYTPPADIARHFSANLNFSFSQSYNIAPTSTVAVLIVLDGERLIIPMRWGLIPSWHKEGQKLTVLNNAKIETIESKPSFRIPFRLQRCLIIANGFYEWDSKAKIKQPYYFHRKDNEPIALAGIWDRWVSEDKSIDSCCIITEAANEVVSPVHERMPGIISRDQYDQWLCADLSDITSIKQLATSSSSYSGVENYPVTVKMNRVVYDNVDCIKHI